MTHVVILGAGIAGVSAAYALKSKLGPHDEVTVVSDQPYFHFVPSNPWVAMGWRDRSDIAFPIGPYLESRGIKFIHSAVKRIQPDVIQVDLENGDVLFYDYLLIATGATGMNDDVPGMAEHTHSVIHVDQAEQALAAYREFVRHPGPIVIGAAPGASVLGPLYEYAFLIDADLKRRNIRERVTMTLVTPEPWPGHLGLGGEGASRGAVTAALVDTKISAICNARTLRVDQDTIHIMEVDAAGNDKQVHTLPFAYSVYWPAFGGVPGVRSATSLVNERGLVVVDEYLRNPDYPNVFALGACVAQPAVDKTPVPVAAPDSVYSISKAGEIVVQNILALINDAPLESHVPQRAKWLTDMGSTGAAYLSEPQVPLRDINWMRQGRWVHLAKIDFEKYFINKIRLQPTGQLPSAASQIAGVMSRVLGEPGAAATPAPAPVAAGKGTPLEIRLPQDPCIELRALAKSLGREPNALAAELLAAAVSDAKTYLSASSIEALAISRRELLVAELPERQPGVEFHGGGT
ncbi:MAG: FAD-dependent oxidoreductase [Thiobacillus sp.]|nr:FAD-dependent oxidoreductase [Thiobacillus sp.]